MIQAQGSVYLDGTPAATGTTIYPGDSIRTGADGAALVNLPERGSLVVAANSDLTFPSNRPGSNFVALHRGKFALHLLPEGSGTTVEFGKFALNPIVSRPYLGQAIEFDVEIGADGSALVRCLDGVIGIIEIQGANSIFLNSGESARISSSGVTERIPGSVPPAQNPAASTTPPPSSKAPGGKSHAGLILLGVGGGGVAALVAVLIIEHKSAPVSPSAP